MRIKLKCEYIDDKELYKAVCFAIQMMREGKRPDIANHRAALYYDVCTYDVARLTGQHSANVKNSRRKK